MENAVVDQLPRLFRPPEMIAQTFLAAQEQAREAAEQFTERDMAQALDQVDSLWESLFPAEQARITAAGVQGGDNNQ